MKWSFRRAAGVGTDLLVRPGTGQEPRTYLSTEVN